MKYNKGDRVLYNRQKFGTVYYDQSIESEVYVVFDREGNVALVRFDMLELVSDAQHEAVLAAQINEAVFDGVDNVPRGTINKSEIVAEHAEPGIAEEFIKLAFELEAGADTETNTLRLRATMKNAALRLRGLAKEL